MLFCTVLQHEIDVLEYYIFFLLLNISSNKFNVKRKDFGIRWLLNLMVCHFFKGFEMKLFNLSLRLR